MAIINGILNGGDADGDVSSGAAFTVDNALVRTDTVSGVKNIQQSGILIDDSDNITAVSSISVGANGFGPGTGIAWGNANTELVELSDNVVDLRIAGAARFEWRNGQFQLLASVNAPAMVNEAATATNVTLAPSRSDFQTGIGWVSAGIGTLIANAKELFRFDDTLGNIITVNDTDNRPGLSIVNDDTTNNTSGLKISGTSSGPAIEINTALGVNNGIVWDDNTAIYSNAPGKLFIDLDGSSKWNFQSNQLRAVNADGAVLFNEISSTTNPTVGPRRVDTATGMGSSAIGAVSLIGNAVEAVGYTEASSHIIANQETHAGITASTTQTQGNGVLLSSNNEIATVANTNDTVTLTAAAIGIKVLIINKGANTLQIFPASGDNLGAGADTATTLAAGANITFFAYDATNWIVVT